jgi:hypothetical protein
MYSISFIITVQDVDQVYCSVFLIKITIFNTKTLKTPALFTRALGGEANLTPLLSPYMAGPPQFKGLFILHIRVQ